MKIVAVVLTIIAIFFPPAWAVSAAAWAAATVGVVFTLATFYITIGIIMLAAGFLLQHLLSYLINELGVDPVLANVLAVAATIAIGDISSISMAQEQWLPLASTIVNAVSEGMGQKYNQKTQDLKNLDEADMREFTKKNDEVLLLLENMRSTDISTYGFDMSIASRAVGGMPINRQIDLAIGEGQYEINMMLQDSISAIIESKKEVVVGM
jgi:hypothetical protein